MSEKPDVKNNCNHIFKVISLSYKEMGWNLIYMCTVCNNQESMTFVSDLEMVKRLKLKKFLNRKRIYTYKNLIKLGANLPERNNDE